MSPHGRCWETFYIFAYGGLVVEIYFFALLPTSTKTKPKPSESSGLRWSLALTRQCGACRRARVFFSRTELIAMSDLTEAQCLCKKMYCKPGNVCVGGALNSYCSLNVLAVLCFDFLGRPFFLNSTDYHEQCVFLHGPSTRQVA